MSVEALRKKYGSAVVLDGIDLEFTSGCTCLLGRNGAGKTTLVRQLVGAEQPSSGAVRVLVRGAELDEKRRMARTGWLPQVFGFPQSMRTRDFVQYAAWLKRVPTSEVGEAVAAALRLADLEDSVHKKLGTLSGGTLRRVGLAAAVVHKPALVVLDEPTAGLDPVQRADFHRHITQISTTSTVLFATHLLEDVEAVADFVHVIDQGTVVWSGTPHALKSLAEAGGRDAVDSLRKGLLALIGSET